MRTSTHAGTAAGHGQAFADTGLDESAAGDVDLEHASVQALIDQLRCLDAIDGKYAARFTVLCDYVLLDTSRGEGATAGTSTAL